MDVKDYLERKREYSAFVKKEGGAILKDFIKEFFDENPTVTGIRWDQFTPSFNDGDPCVFSVYDPYLSVGEIPKESEEDADEEIEESDVWMASYYIEEKIGDKKLAKNFDTFSDNLTNKLADLCLSVFGDYATVQALRNKKGKIIFRITECSPAY